MLAGWATAIVAYWLPWLAPGPAALQFNGFQLAEWTTRLPVQNLGPCSCHLNFLGILAGLALLGGLLSGIEPEKSAALRRSLGAISALHMALILPGYPFVLGILRDPEARAQGMLTLAAAIGLGLAYLLAPRIKRHLRYGMAGLLAFAISALAYWSLAAVRPQFARLLPEMGNPGSGFSLFLAGCLIVCLAGLAGAVATWKD